MNRYAIIENVNNRMTAQCWTIPHFLKEAGIGKDTWAKYQEGRRQPSVFALLRMSQVLGCTMEDLCEGVDG